MNNNNFNNDISEYSRYSRQGKYHASNPQSGNEISSPQPIVIAVIVALIVVIVLAVIAGVFLLRPSTTSTKTQTATPAQEFDIKDTASQINSPEAEASIVLTLFGDHNTYVLKGEQYLEPGSHAVENKSKDISSSIKVEGKVDTSTPGDYTVTYTATGTSGLMVQRTRTVHVVNDMDKNTAGVPVLMYHYVYTASAVPDDLDGNSILDTDLAAQLNYLVENKYYFPSYQELRAYVSGTHTLPAKSIILTFDDGSPDFLAYGIPMLEKYKVPATSFIVGVDNIGPCTQNPSEYVTYQSHSYDMHRAGGSYGHGGRIGAMSQAEIVADLRQNIALLGSADAFAYPYGDAPDAGIAAVKEAGILCAFTTNYGNAKVGDDPANLTRIRVQGQADLSAFISSIE